MADYRQVIRMTSRLCIRCDVAHTHGVIFTIYSRRKLYHNNLTCYINDFVSHYTGQQEYSSRQAGVTTGIILACLVPILLMLICVGHKVLRNRRVQRENEEALARTRAAELQRLRKIGEEDESMPYRSRATEIN